ncbi:aldo/keto reductase [Roseomonas eburnea]|uniref:Aldo/keto reductase n=1 Tax=Neoroseomonas eburnea TaxID=1346889 RepID=A0A9X9XIZ0_9PROT|nr:aldo/keto reductase [Neoroseomonas eburnea]MBR0683676.1 aldo/keto reductase [Neoroseomonas eburnea]
MSSPLPRRLGGRDHLPLGLGCMGMSDFYGPADEATSIATIHAALDAGVTYVDTGDFYGSGHNETLLGRALAGRRDRAFVAVKFGALRDPAGGFVGFDARPASIRNFLAMTLKRLGTDHVDLYMPARVPADVPIEEVAGTVGDLIRAGWVRHFGLSEAGPASIARAHAVTPVAALQIEYGLLSRSIEANGVLALCREGGIPVTAYGVLGRGLIGGSRPSGAGDFRAHSPRFEAANLARNEALAAALAAAAARFGATPAQAAIAWVLSRGADILPLVGARRPDRLAEALATLSLHLPAEAIAAFEAAVPDGAVAGARYAPDQMAMLDSERVAAA